jgi:hypothetical protein
VASARGAAGKLLAALELAAAALAGPPPPRYAWARRILPTALPKQRGR